MAMILPFFKKIIMLSFFLVWIFGLAGCVAGANGIGMRQKAVGQPTKVALLLPLQGPNAANGQAIRNGFLTAYYYAKERQSNAPAVEVMDTSQGSILDVYQQAVSRGARFVVGPLTKGELQALAEQNKLSVPTLALNTLDNTSRVDNLYQFGLSPLDEATQAAVRAKQDGHRRVLVIAPAGEWGQKIAAAFIKQWKALGGVVVNSYAYQTKADFSYGIRTSLRIENTMSKNTHSGFRYVPNSNMNADVIFLAAFPQQARQIKPTLNFYGAGSIPVYGTSLIYSGIPSPMYDQDLNGIEFEDMPWILGPDKPQWAQMRDRIKNMWASSYSASPRLYALGIDAYHITYRLNSLIGSSATLTGATGQLSVDADQHIKRQLEWARMENGVPTLLLN